MVNDDVARAAMRPSDGHDDAVRSGRDVAVKMIPGISRPFMIMLRGLY